MARLFGTDGVRGIANRELSPGLAFKLGKAGAHILSSKTGEGQVVIGRDTRISGTMLECALAAGICSAGLNVLRVGVLPTPAVAYLTRKLGASAGVVISASHNPAQDNGIKFFASNGFKLPDSEEDEIEALIQNGLGSFFVPTGTGVGKVETEGSAERLYADHAKQTSNGSFSGMKIIVDCANGAAYRVAPGILSELGADVEAIFSEPNGTNINDDCGSTHPEKLCERIKACGADMGFAFDGDADRLIAVDEEGNIVDGDKILHICASWL
ncbi:MAG: phosphoglucosamine mutase, partial [Desulfotomaculaceae bacterium]